MLCPIITILHNLTLTVCLSLSVSFMLPFCVSVILISTFLLLLKELPLEFLVSRCSSNKLTQFLFVWESSYPFFISEGQLHWVYNSWLTGFFLSIFWICHAILFWPKKFLLRSTDSLLVLYNFSLFSCWCLNSFFIFTFWQPNYNMSRCKPIQFNLFGVICASWFWDVHFFPQGQEVFIIIALCILSVHFSFSSLSRIPKMQMLFLFITFH